MCISVCRNRQALFPIIRSTNVSFGSTNYSGFISIYGGITGAAILLNFSRIIIIFVVTINASRVLHSRMFAAVMRAPILFFDSNTLGKSIAYLTTALIALFHVQAA